MVKGTRMTITQKQKTFTAILFLIISWFVGGWIGFLVVLGLLFIAYIIDYRRTKRLE